jgi:hypothetical protein
MTIAWLVILAVMALALLFFYRAPRGNARALGRLALLHGVQRMRGESDESLRNRTAGAARWPYSHPEPAFVWWARAWHRVTRAPRRSED